MRTRGVAHTASRTLLGRRLGVISGLGFGAFTTGHHGSERRERAAVGGRGCAVALARVERARGLT